MANSILTIKMYWVFFYLNIVDWWKFYCIWQGEAFLIFLIQKFSFSIYHLPIHIYLSIHLFTFRLLIFLLKSLLFFNYLYSHFLRIVLIVFNVNCRAVHFHFPLHIQSFFFFFFLVTILFFSIKLRTIISSWYIVLCIWWDHSFLWLAFLPWFLFCWY